MQQSLTNDGTAPEIMTKGGARSKHHSGAKWGCHSHTIACGNGLTAWEGLIDGGNTVNPLRESGFKLFSVQDGIDPDTTSGRLKLNVLATLPE